MERIIAEFLEINADINLEYHESKDIYPIKKIKYNHYKRRLKRNIKKLEKSNIILTKNNLLELFAFLYSEFDANSKFDCITKITGNEKNYSYNVSFDFENGLTGYIYTEKDSETFRLGIFKKIDKGAQSSWTLDLKSLKSSKIDSLEIVDEINTKMKMVLVNFLYYKFDAYNYYNKKGR